jgi:hypothetical protein
MKYKIKSLLVILIVLFHSCGLNLNEELDKDSAEILIAKDIQFYSKSQLQDCNAQQIISASGDYLFVTNSFNGEFNGYVYSIKDNQNFKSLKFNKLYITSFDISDGNWTKVYGKW